MNDTPLSVIVRAPITMKLGPVPADIDTHSKIATFGLAHFQSIIRGANPDAQIDGESAIVSYLADGTLTSFTIGGAALDNRHYRVQPKDEGHGLELSEDKGVTFAHAATFGDYDLARGVGDAWVDGRIGKVA